MEKSNLAVAHAEDAPIEPHEKLAINEIADKAKQGAEAEHNLPPLKALRLYPKAIFWCLVVSACVIMEGYDTNLLSNFYAYPEFAKKYGHFNEATNNYQLSAPWQMSDVFGYLLVSSSTMAI